MPLTDRKIKSLKSSPKPRKVSDAGGLYVLVHPNGSKYWRMKFRIAGREKTLALGVYPDVTLSAARGGRDSARRLLASGKDPSAVKQAEKQSRVDSFKALSLEWMGTRSLDPVHEKKVRQRFERDLFPKLGAVPVVDLTVPMIHMALKRIVDRGSLETARRALQNVSQVMRFAVGKGILTFDPTTAMRDALPVPVVTHFPAIVEPERLGEFLKTIEKSNAEPQVRAALRIAPMLAVRPGELRRMEWNEIDFEDEKGPLWSIPAAKMKRRRPHIVPIAPPAEKILRELEPVTRRSRYVFPGLRDSTRPLSDGTLNKAIRAVGYSTSIVTVHGFRATFRTLAAEILGEPAHLIEHQLAHEVKDPLGRAYNRTEHLPERREMMRRWTAYLEGLRLKDAKVIPIGRLARKGEATR
jgi:integrase